MRAEVLELMAEEIAGRPVDPLASFRAFDGEGRARLEGMTRGRLWDFDREQRAFDQGCRHEFAVLARRQRGHRMKRIDRVLVVAASLAAARAEVAKLEAQLAGLLGAEKPAASSRGAGRPAPKAPRGERARQVIALSKEGLDAGAIAARLGCSKQNVHVQVSLARAKGLLPKPATNGVAR